MNSFKGSPARTTFFNVRRLRYAIAALGIVAVTATVMVVALEPKPPTVEAAPIIERSTTEPHPATITFAVAGDSITAYDNHEMPECAAACVLSERTWTYWADSPRTGFVGGYAESGNKSWEVPGQMPAIDADVLVIMLGTNDVTAGSPASVLLTQLDSIIATAQERHVLIAAIAPQELDPQAAVNINAALSDYARTHHYGFVDPWLEVRDGIHWAAGISGDGIHPLDAATFHLAGERIATAILALHGGKSLDGAI